MGLCPQGCHVKVAEGYCYLRVWRSTFLVGRRRKEKAGRSSLFLKKGQLSKKPLTQVSLSTAMSPLRARKPGEVFLEKLTAILTKMGILLLRVKGEWIWGSQLALSSTNVIKGFQGKHEGLCTTSVTFLPCSNYSCCLGQIQRTEWTWMEGKNGTTLVMQKKKKTHMSGRRERENESEQVN